MQADLGTSFPGMNPHVNQEVINSNEQLYGSLLNLAEAYQKAGGNIEAFSEALSAVAVHTNKSADDCKKLVNELNTLASVNVNGIDVEFKGFDTEQLKKVVQLV